jgi:hypothetical protein
MMCRLPKLLAIGVPPLLQDCAAMLSMSLPYLMRKLAKLLAVCVQTLQTKL